MRKKMMTKRALLIVDLQNDFLPGGALPVTDGDQLPAIVDRLLQQPFDCIVASKDWHPANHGSFAANHKGKKVGDRITLNGLEQILWPVHCVQDSLGSEFAPGWDTKRVHKVIHKGTDPMVDSYSAFFDNGQRKSTGLAEYLKEQKVGELYVVGLATDYCVKHTVLDAVRLGFKTYLIEDACSAVNLQPDDEEKALDEMEAAGAIIS
jgi:nicotinamidase/pyrazinamidase